MQLSHNELQLFPLDMENNPLFKDHGNLKNLFEISYPPLWDKNDNDTYYEDKDELRYK